MNPRFPRTFHLPWSEEKSDNDKVLSNVDHLLNCYLSISIKMDGSNVGLSREHLSSRGGDIPKHESFDLLKQKYSLIKYEIPEDFIFYGEWLYAVHSIEYNDLDDYLMIFAIFDRSQHVWLSVKDVIEYSQLIGFQTVPFIKHNLFYKTEEDFKNGIVNIARNTINKGHEGIVVRKSGYFNKYYGAVAKYVRESHVQTDEHWSNKPIKKQGIKE